MSNTANNNIIESKSVLLSILNYSENTVVEDRGLDTPAGIAAGLSVSLVRLSTNDWAVCDKSFEGNYYAYLFDESEEDVARECYAKIASDISDTEQIEAE